MKLVIKIGGTLLQQEDSRAMLALQAGSLMRDGHRLLLVHGGGAQVTAYMKTAGIESQFVEGRRVTSAPVLDAAVKVMAGSVNHEFLAAFAAAGVPACGISGIDGSSVYADRADRSLGGLGLGFVGKVSRVNPRLFDALNDGGFVPVMACLAVGSGGQILNVNADEVAVGCAAAWLADRIIFLSDIDGVRGASGEILRSLTPASAENLVKTGVATGGMVAKLRSACMAVERGIPGVEIAPGHRPRILHSLLAGTGEWGTSLRLSETVVRPC